MKIKLFSLLTLTMCLAVLFAAVLTANAAEAAPISVLVNGKSLDLDVAPLIEEGRTLVPVRAIAESLGAVVGWDAQARRVEISLNEDRLSLIIDNNIAYVNGIPRQLEAPARIVGGRTLVPIRFISESLHAEVEWAAVSRTVIITTYVDMPAFSAALAQLEAALLQELNQRRAKLSRAALTPVEERNQMARSHAAELAQTDAFTHVSPRFGDTAARAAARGLTVHFEYLAMGLPDAAAMAEALLRGEHGARLLAEDALFLGLGLYKKNQEGNADIYVVAELIEGSGFIQGPRQRRPDTAASPLNGYALAGAPLTLYLLNGAGEYTSRYGYTLSVDGAGRFSFRLSLPQQGRYAAVVGQDSVILIYE
jgi:uncharacterized protein YkwD